MGKHDYGAIRELAEAAFDDEALNRFCFDSFTEIFDKFTAGQTKGQRILSLVDHVRRHGLTDKLLREIQKANPYQYGLFESGVSGKDSKAVSQTPRKKPEPKPAEPPPSAGSQEKIRWLHLSDLHLTSVEKKGPTEAFNQDLVTTALVKTVAESNLRPDFIVITGDIARMGKPEEYAVCEVFLERLLDAAGLERDRLFLVPGNHDVNRSEIKPNHIKRWYPFDSQEEVSDILTDPDMFPIIMKKFDAFNAFAEKALGRRLFDASKFWFSEMLPIRKNDRDVVIRLVGLNSSLLAGYDTDDRQNLALGLYQVNPAVDSLGTDGLSVGLFHHPFSCYHSADRVCQNLFNETSGPDTHRAHA